MFVWTNFLSTLTAENGPQTAHCFILSPTNVEPCNALLTPVTKSSAALFVQSRVKYLSILTMEIFLKDFTWTVHLANKWKCANPTTLNTSCWFVVDCRGWNSLYWFRNNEIIMQLIKMTEKAFTKFWNSKPQCKRLRSKYLFLNCLASKKTNLVNVIRMRIYSFEVIALYY